MNEVVLGTGFGVIMGPHCANIFDPRSWGDQTQRVTLEVMRIVLATGLFAIGVELPRSYMADHAKGLLVMVVPTMAFGWLIVAGMRNNLCITLSPHVYNYNRDCIRSLCAHQLYLLPRYCSLSDANRPYYLCGYRRYVHNSVVEIVLSYVK